MALQIGSAICKPAREPGEGGVEEESCSLYRSYWADIESATYATGWYKGKFWASKHSSIIFKKSPAQIKLNKLFFRLNKLIHPGSLSNLLRYSIQHGRRNSKDTKSPSRLYWCLIEFIGRDTVSHVGISLWPLPPLPTSQSKRTVYSVLTVCGSVWGVLSCVVDHILQEFNTLFLTSLDLQNCYTIQIKNTSKDDI